MKTNIVKFDAPELQSIEPSKAKQIKDTFEPMAEMLLQFESAYFKVIKESEGGITEEVTNKAKRLRLDIAKVRIETERVRKEQKEEYLRAGKAIDGVSNILKWAVVDRENKLKEIEDYFEIQEQKRLEKLQEERIKALSLYVEDIEGRVLSNMDEDVWAAYLEVKKKEYEDRIAAEKKAEEERIAREKAEEKERERIKKENEKLKKEAEEREKAERLQQEKIQKEREEYESRLKAQQEEREMAEKEERIKREKLEAELQAKEEAERRVKEAEKVKTQNELSKKDIDRVNDLIEELKVLKVKYTFKSNKNKKMYENVGVLIDKIITYING